MAEYIQQQLGAGHSPDAIAGQLRGANWPENAIQAAFSAAQQSMMPSPLPPATPAPDATAPANAVTTQQPSQLATTSRPQANGSKRGRIRTGWQLFKQSWRLLRGNPYLFRYMFMTGVWVFTITVVFVVIYFVFDSAFFTSDDDMALKPLGYVLAFLDYLAIYFFINLYAAGLTANVFDIFRGTKKPYREYMHVAWSKAPAILVFSIISAIVGMLLEYVVERIRFVGWILSWVLGTLWSLGTLFVIPIIVSSDKPSGVSSIKQSVSFFKQTWGEDVTAKLSVNAPLFLIQLALIGVFFIVFFAFVSLFGWIGLLIAVVLYLILFLAVSVVGSFANSLVNIALFYYATTGQVPPAFSEDLLNSVFSKRKRRFFGRKTPKTAEA